MQTAIDDVEEVFTLPPTPEPDLDDPDDSDWLFDSGRSYLEQLAYYKARRRAEDDANELSPDTVPTPWPSPARGTPHELGT